MVNSIDFEYLEPKKEFRIGSIKNIAVPSNNKDDIKRMYSGYKKGESNADMLSQSFGQTPEIVPIPNNIVEQTPVNEPVEISSIPLTQSSNLESSPVNLDMNVSSTIPEFPTMDPIKPVENQMPEDNNVVIPNEVNPIESNIMPINSGIESDFKVSSSGNIFDNPNISPISINEEINKPVDKIMNNDVTPVDFKDKTYESNSVSVVINDDILLTEIAIEENNIKHYEGLAENSRKKIELLKKQIKNDKKDDVNLENTASNLFNNNGILDDDKVLGRTPMPNLRVA